MSVCGLNYTGSRSEKKNSPYDRHIIIIIIIMINNKTQPVLRQAQSEFSIYYDLALPLSIYSIFSYL
jgi:hypothetical protein